MFILSRCGGLLGHLVVDRLGRFGQSVGILGAREDQVGSFTPLGVAAAVPLDNDRARERALAYADALLLLPEGPDERPIDEARLIDEAARAGVARVLRISMHGARADAGSATLRHHASFDEALRDSGLTYSILRPHLFIQDLLLFAPSVQAGYPLRGPVSAPRIGFIDIRDLADAVVTLLQRPIHQGEEFTLTGSRTWSLEEVAHALAEATSAPIAYETVADEDMVAHLQSIGLSQSRAASVAGLLAAYGHADEATRSVSRLTGLPPRALEMFLLDHRGHFASRPVPAPNNADDMVQLDHALTW